MKCSICYFPTTLLDVQTEEDGVRFEYKCSRCNTFYRKIVFLSPNAEKRLIDFVTNINDKLCEEEEATAPPENLDADEGDSRNCDDHVLD